MLGSNRFCSFFFFNDTAPPEFSPLPLHDALPFSSGPRRPVGADRPPHSAPPRQRDALPGALPRPRGGGLRAASRDGGRPAAGGREARPAGARQIGRAHV